MSLQVWLPLNGNLNNQGLGTSAVIGTNAYTVTNSGKIGKCITTSTSAKIDLGYNGNIINTNSISIGGWFKFNQAAIETQLSTLTYPATSPTATGNLIGNGSYGGVGLVWTANKTTASDPLTWIKVYMYVRTSTNGAKATAAYTVPFDTWVHIMGIFDKTTTKSFLYINGTVFASLTNTTFSDAPSRNLYINYNSVMGGNGPGAYIPFDCNDVRVYDHCLSENEVKNIAQGLVIHYPLADKNSEATKNLYSGTFSNTCYNGAINKYGYGATTDIYKTDGIFQNKQCTKVYMGTAGNDAYPYIYFDAFNAAGSTIQTLSFDYFPTSQASIVPYSYNNAYDWSWVVNGVTGNRDNNATCATLPVKLNQWNHIELTTHKTDSSDTTRGIGYIRIGTAKHTSTTTDYWLFANIQVEAKNHGTAYTPFQRGGLYDSAVYQESDGSLWVRMFHHNNPANGLFAQADTFTTGVYKDADRWFDVYGVVNQLKRYEFMVKQKATSDATEVKYRWIQNKSPLTATYADVAPSAVTRITTSGYTNGGNGGLWKLNSNTHMVIANSNSGNWYGATGSWTAYSGGIPGYPNTTITTGYMDLYARVDDLDLSKVYDISGFNNDGKIVGTVSITNTTKRYDRTLQFNGTDACIIVPYNATCPTNIFTVNLWFKKDALGSKSYETLFGGPSGFEMDTRSGSSTTLTLYMASVRGGTLWSSFSLNTWYMVTMVRDGTNEFYYINGELVKTIEAKSMPTGTYFIGAWSTSVKQNFYGLISDFRIYATPLDAAAIQELYRMGGQI